MIVVGLCVRHMLCWDDERNIGFVRGSPNGVKTANLPMVQLVYNIFTNLERSSAANGTIVTKGTIDRLLVDQWYHW